MKNKKLVYRSFLNYTENEKLTLNQVVVWKLILQKIRHQLDKHHQRWKI